LLNVRALREAPPEPDGTPALDATLSRLAAELRAASEEIIARNRAAESGGDPS
jgi:hypothetical protein